MRAETLINGLGLIRKASFGLAGAGRSHKYWQLGSETARSPGGPAMNERAACYGQLPLLCRRVEVNPGTEDFISVLILWRDPFQNERRIV
jgi:hypothetical protein